MTAAGVLAALGLGLAVLGWAMDEWPWRTRAEVETLAGLCALVGIALAVTS